MKNSIINSQVINDSQITGTGNQQYPDLGATIVPISDKMVGLHDYNQNKITVAARNLVAPMILDYLDRNKYNNAPIHLSVASLPTL